jgi:prepilin-type N-terminal cleavage/methylation domain-containing protein
MHSFSSTSRRLRRGFTLVELLVVIAIIAMLVALLLPAVQSARESARRVRCGNNLKQFGHAIVLYNEMQGHFPNNGGKGWGSISSGPGMFTIKLLPYLEQAAVYKRICRDADIDRVDVFPVFANDAELKSLVLPTFRCPSSRFPSLNEAGEAITDYAGSSGAQAVNPYWCNQYQGNRWGTGPEVDSNWVSDDLSKFELSGMFSRLNYYGLRMTAKNIPDGLTNTIAMGEVRPDCSVHGGLPWWSNHKCIITTSIPLNYPTCPGEPPGNDGSSGNNCHSYWSWSTELGFKSPHPLSVGFVFADGSVKFLNELIDFDNLNRLGCRRDGTDPNPNAHVNPADRVLKPF